MTRRRSDPDPGNEPEPSPPLCDIGVGLLAQSVVIAYLTKAGVPEEERLFKHPGESLAALTDRAIAEVTRRGDDPLTVRWGGYGVVLWQASRRQP